MKAKEKLEKIIKDKTEYMGYGKDNHEYTAIRGNQEDLIKAILDAGFIRKEDVELPIKVWQLVKQIEEKSESADVELGEIRATLLETYGKKGNAIPDLISETDNTLSMLVIVLAILCPRPRSISKGDY